MERAHKKVQGEKIVLLAIDVGESETGSLSSQNYGNVPAVAGPKVRSSKYPVIGLPRPS
jgi:hypothetical protein